MISTAADYTAFSYPPAIVSYGGELESFSRSVPEQSWNRWLEWLEAIRDDPQRFQDDMTITPRVEIVATAIDILSQLRHATTYPPTSMMIEPNGGIIFERRCGDRAVTITVYADGSVEYDAYVGVRLVETRSLMDADIDL
jgi:hypothetical protein